MEYDEIKEEYRLDEGRTKTIGCLFFIAAVVIVITLYLLIWNISH